MPEEVKKQQNPLAKFDQQMMTATSVKDLFSLPDVKDRFIKNYEAVTSRKDGANRLEQERMAYMEKLNDFPELKKAPMWSHFSALLKAGTTGLSFRDNKLYVQAVKNREGVITGLKVDPSPAGRREMMEFMPNVKKVPQAQVVMKGDLFVYDKLNEKIIKHETTEKSLTEDKLENVVCAYQRIIWKDGTVSDVVVPQSDLLRARAKTKTTNWESGVWHWNAEACKKVATKRAHRLYHKYPDNVILYSNDKDTDDGDTSDVDSVDVTGETSYVDPDMASGNTVAPEDLNPPADNVDRETGEVFTPEVVQSTPKTERKSKL